MGHFSFLQFLLDQYSRFPPLEPRDLNGKTVLVIGGNAGLGFEASKHIGSMSPSKLVLACRNMQKGEKAAKDIRKATDCKNVVVRVVDLASFESIVAFATSFNNEEKRLDVCLYNAGIFADKYEATVDGNESIMQVNFMSCVLLSLLLVPLMIHTASLEPNGPHPRLVMVTSDTHYWAEPTAEESESPNLLQKLNDEQYSRSPKVMDKRYFFSKLVQILFMRELATRINSSVIVNAVNPGFCRSKIRNTMSFPASFFTAIFAALTQRPTELGGRLITWAAVSATHRERDLHGKYISDMQVKEESDFALSREGYALQRQIWNETVEVLSKVSPDIKEVVTKHLSLSA